MNAVLTIAVILALAGLAIGIAAWLRNDDSPGEESWYDL